MVRFKDIRTTIWAWVGPVVPMPPHACKTTIDTCLKPLLIGADPLGTEYLWQTR